MFPLPCLDKSPPATEGCLNKKFGSLPALSLTHGSRTAKQTGHALSVRTSTHITCHTTVLASWAPMLIASMTSPQETPPKLVYISCSDGIDVRAQNSAAQHGNNPSYAQLSRRFPMGCECHQVGLELNTSKKSFEMIQAGKYR